MIRLRRPPADAPGPQRRKYLSDLAEALDYLGVQRGDEFLIGPVPKDGSRAVAEDAPGGARTSDPDTSKRAAKRHVGKSGTQRHSIYMAIENAGERGMTSDEAVRATGIEGGWKRISELHDWGFIAVAGERTALRSDNMVQVYVSTIAGRASARGV